MKDCAVCGEQFTWYPSWKNRVTCSRACGISLRYPHKYPKELYKSRFYRVWSDIKTRCYNEKSEFYYRYGGRGIRVCDKWDSFSGFYDDMFESYKDNLEIERIDNDKGYFPDNCRWATRKEQCNNRSNSRYITIEGNTKTLAQWTDLSGIKPSTVRQRLYVLKWSAERALGMES